jgi:hypothetical protein
MKPVSPVLPDSGLPEVAFGANQPEYMPLPAVCLDGAEGEILTRWELTDEDRARILAGGSVYLHIYTFGQRLQPVLLSTESPTLDVLTPDGIRRIGGA